MRKTTASLIAVSLLLSAPGPGVWAAVGRVALPKAHMGHGLPGVMSVIGNSPGAVSMPGVAGTCMPDGVTQGALPGVTRVAPQLNRLNISPAALPVSPQRMQSYPGVQASPSGASLYRAPTGSKISDQPMRQGRAGRESSAAPTSTHNGQKRSLLKTLRLPSLFSGQGRSGLEEAHRLATDDFRLHAGGGAPARGAPARGASGQGASVRGQGQWAAGRRKASVDFSSLPGKISASAEGAGKVSKGRSASHRRSGVSGWRASAYRGVGPIVGGPSRASGLLRRHTPDGAPKVLNIRSVRPAPAGVEAAAVSLARSASESKQVSAASQKEERPAKSEREYRSAYFPLMVAMVSAASLGVAMGLSALIQFSAPSLFPVGALQALSASAGVKWFSVIAESVIDVVSVTAALAGVYALWESLVFAVGVALRGEVSDQEFQDFLKKELKRWNLHPSVRASLLGQGPGHGILKPYRPPGKFTGLAYGFTAGGAIYLRPEMIRTPWLFRWVLKHELAHLEKYFTRGPPQRLTGRHRLTRSFFSELSARFGEFRASESLSALRIPVLDRVLTSARLSLRRSKPYDILLVHPGHHEVRNSATYQQLSEGSAHVVELYTKTKDGESVLQVDNDEADKDDAGSIPALSSGDRLPDRDKVRAYLERAANAGRFRMVVYPQSFGALPAEREPEGVRLKHALKQLDQIYTLSRQLPLLERNGGRPSRQAADISRLTDARGIAWHPGMSAENLADIIDQMYFQASRQALGRSGFVKTLESLYGSLHHHGTLVLPFAHGEPGLDTVDRILRYWRAEDGGQFSVMRVDLPEGGHVLVARKAEPRVDLWLRPAEGKECKTSYTNVNTAHSKTPGQEKILQDAGFSDLDIERFRLADMEVRHVFGGDVGDNRIYVNVRRSHAQLLRKYAVESDISLQNSERFDLHLVESGPMQNADKTWNLGFSGAGGRIYDIDTGLDVSHPDFADRSLTSVDFVDEGPEDWIGHGTHKAGISYANGTIYRGMAPEAEGRMGKVFAQNGTGASDGEIMAAAVDAMQWGADVISLSLGSPGTVEAPLAQFFSQLTRQKNANGEYPIVTGSAGNSGPFNRTKSQPSVGEFVASIAAAAKSLDDGVPEMSFYSSVGPAYDRRYGIERYRRPLGLTALGGDVTTPLGVKDVYSAGIESSKSKDMPAGPSDAEDGRHTRMSGTSMSNPMIAGIALLVKQAIASVIESKTEAFDFFSDQLPFVVNMVLMRSSKDMRVPIFFQEGGFVDAYAAVNLGARSFGGELVSAPRRAWRAAKALFSSRGRKADTDKAKDDKPWEWIVRARTVWELEDQPYIAGDHAREQALKDLRKKMKARSSENTDAPEESPRAEMLSKHVLGHAGGQAMRKAFEATRAKVVPELLKALEDEVWLVRMYAAYALLNLKAPEAVLPLAKAALEDADGRVRQTAFLAIAETPSYAADEALKQALSDGRADVEIYAGYALARHGEPSGIKRMIAHAQDSDKKVRFSAAWLLGQLGRRAPPEITDALASRVMDTEERGNIRHVSVASLTEIALAKAQSLTNETILNLLYSSGPENVALTRTISQFFAAAARSPHVRSRMAQKPLRDDILTFIHKHKASVHHPGALGELVRMLSQILNVSLDAPTPLPNPSGVGVPGVDATFGSVDLIVEVPEGAGHRIARFEDFRDRGASSNREAAAAAVEREDAAARALGFEPQMLKTYGVRMQAAMAQSQALWFSAPDSNVIAFTAEMESQGYLVRRAAPMYRLTHETKELSGIAAMRKKTGLSGEGVLIAYLDEGGDTAHPAIPAKRIYGKKNFTTDGTPNEVESESVSHGTHGMGIVGGESVEGSPYEGMAPGVQFAIGKVLGATGGNEAAVMAGMEWAASLVENPLKNPVIINMSLGGPGSPDSPISRLVNTLRLKNIGVVTAAGNSGPMEGTVSSPANAALAISVGAVDKNKALTDYSSRSPKGVRELSWVDFGGAVFFDRPNLYEIVSALNTRLQEAMADAPTGVTWKGKLLYHTMSGTSMAAPHTTGKLALLIERMRAAFPEGLPSGYMFYLEKLVEKTAVRMEQYGENEVGAGLIDDVAALAALDKALKNPAQVAVESEAMILQAREAHGPSAATAAPAGGWFTRVYKKVIAPVAGSLSSLCASLFFV